MSNDQIGWREAWPGKPNGRAGLAVLLDISGPYDGILQGLTDRLRTLLRVLDRQDRLETASAFVGWLDGEAAAARLPDAARELLLRALRLAGDPVNYQILGALGPEEAVTAAALMEKTGLGRVALSERVNDLAQVGLAARDPIGDDVRATPLAVGLRALVEELGRRVGDRLAEELRDRPA